MKRLEKSKIDLGKDDHEVLEPKVDQSHYGEPSEQSEEVNPKGQNSPGKTFVPFAKPSQNLSSLLSTPRWSCRVKCVLFELLSILQLSHFIHNNFNHDDVIYSRYKFEVLL